MGPEETMLTLITTQGLPTRSHKKKKMDHYRHHLLQRPGMNLPKRTKNVKVFVELDEYRKLEQAYYHTLTFTWVNPKQIMDRQCKKATPLHKPISNAFDNVIHLLMIICEM